MPRLLIVDDDHTMVSLLTTLLGYDGFEVATAPDGASATAQARDFRPDAFLVDYYLTDCAGTDLVARLRSDSLFRDAPIILASGIEREAEALASGADLFLAKPFNPAELVSVLKRLLGH